MEKGPCGPFSLSYPAKKRRAHARRFLYFSLFLLRQGRFADLEAALEGRLVQRVHLRALGAQLLERRLQHVLRGQEVGVPMMAPTMTRFITLGLPSS